MSAIADSSAVLVKKILPQHHTAITLLGGLLAAPDTATVDWLDLACGKGQIISQFEQNIAEPEMRAKIAYNAYDIENDHARAAEQIARGLNFRAVVAKTGEMEDFERVFPAEQKFSFISFTNTVHELRPQSIGALLIALILRLDVKGVLYIYDMEALPFPELGAVPWLGEEFKKIVVGIVRDLGGQPASPLVQKWNHASCSGWSLNLQREYLQLSDDCILKNTDKAVNGASKTIAEIIVQKTQSTIKALEALTRFGSANEEENQGKIKLLYNFWGLQRASQSFE